MMLVAATVGAFFTLLKLSAKIFVKKSLRVLWCYS